MIGPLIAIVWSGLDGLLAKRRRGDHDEYIARVQAIADARRQRTLEADARAIINAEAREIRLRAEVARLRAEMEIDTSPAESPAPHERP